MKAIIADDADKMVELMRICLTRQWPNIGLVATDSGLDAVRLTRAVGPDFVLLDLELADLYGLQVLKEVRDFSDVPVIVITANSEEPSRLKSLELGANDYLVKPFSNVELLGCISAALWPNRASRSAAAKESLVGRGYVVNISGKRVTCDGDVITLTEIEWAVLLELIYGYGGTVPYATICQAGWGTETVQRPIVHDCVQQLGSKLGDDPRKPSLIQTQGDEGYSCSLFS